MENHLLHALRQLGVSAKVLESKGTPAKVKEPAAFSTSPGATDDDDGKKGWGEGFR